MTTAPQEAHERISFHSVRAAAKRPVSVGWLTTVLGLAAAAGLGWYAFELQGQLAVSQQALASSQVALAKQTSTSREALLRLRTLEADGAERAAAQRELSEELANTSARLAAASTRLDELGAERGQMEEQLGELRQMTRDLSRMIDSGRLKVSFRRGRMVLDLPAQVLFASGSADLTDEGKDAIRQVSKGLRGFQSRHFIVAGHTDNVPVSGRFANNWELSSARAVTVTQELVRAGLQPAQLVAAGYGEFDPVARNTTDTGKQKNRRIEIILEPRLRELRNQGESRALSGH